MTQAPRLPTTAYEVGKVPQRRHGGRMYATVCGFLYIMGSVSCSSWYLTLAEPNLQNDIWWPDFNATGVLTFLGDLVHSRLNLQVPRDTFELADNPPTLHKTYGQESTVLSLPPSSPRRALLGDIPFQDAISALRTESLDTTMAYRMPFCWVDLGKVFEMAHSRQRQDRCKRRDTDNAAVHLDAVLRNVNASALLDWTLFDLFNQTVLVPLQHVANGTSWASSLLGREKVLSVPDEAAMWTHHGLLRFTLQLQNRHVQLLEDSILIEDALGIQQKFTIRSISTSQPMEAAPGTTFWTGLSLISDLLMAASLNMSLVLGTPNDAHALGLDWDTDVMFPVGQGVPGMDLLRSHVGPLGAIDIRYVSVPTDLAAYFLAWRSSLYGWLQRSASSVLNTYVHAAEPHVHPVPIAWQNLSYYGGNPMCPMQDPKSYIQPSFGITDDCTDSGPYTVQLRRESVLFALVSSGISTDQVMAVCGLTDTAQDDCLSTLTTAMALVTVWNQTTAFQIENPPPVIALSKLNITFMQFATAIDDMTAQVLLLQPLVAPGDLWSFYGWIGVHEWLSGRREVYSFEGDVATLTVLTEPQDEIYFEANELEISRKGCFYIWYITVYITYVLVAVVTVMILYAFYIKFDVEWWNLFSCNWVVGCVWVGRPFLFLRGMTAMLLLSSGSVSFVNHQGFSSLVASPLSLVNTMVITGEATWLTIVFHDFLLPFSDPDATLHAPISTGLVWVVLTIIQVTMPHTVSVSLQPSCTYPLLGIQASCTSAVVQFGSLARLGWLCLVHVVCIVVVYGLVKVYFATTHRHKGRVHGVPNILIPGVVHAFFVQCGHGDIYLDKVACVMCGMLSYSDTIFHIPSWTKVTKQPIPRGVGYMFPVASLTVPAINSAPRADDVDSSSITIIDPPQGTPEGDQHHKYIRWIGLLGLGHMVASVAGSYGYLLSVETVMANDFWWAGFNTTGHQTYLANWFNSQLQGIVAATSEPTLVTALHFGELGTQNDYSSPDTVVFAAPLYASAIQLEVNTLPNVVAGLRTMQGCDVPWIAAAYCYVDFGRKWEMANSMARQGRCEATERQNAAVYLEAALRNANWESLTSCWGESLAIGVFSYLDTVQDGKAWRQTLPSRLSVDAEVQWWQAQGVSEYVTQWQNYKQLGVVETFDVQNAFGFTYPMTIKRSRGLFRTHEESGASSFKMAWGLASELWAVTTNTTVLGGLHLIRQSPRFAFQNVTPADALAENQTLAYPLSQGLDLVQATLGPFGSIDMKRVACPASLRQLYQNLTEALVLLLNVDASTVSGYEWLLQNNANHSFVVETYQSLLQNNLSPFPLIPAEWNVSVGLCGGKLMCGFDSCGGRMAQDFFSSTEVCDAPLELDATSPTNENLLKAMLAVGVKTLAVELTVHAFCSCASKDPSACTDCVNMLANGTLFLATYMTPQAILQFREMAKPVERHLRDDVQLDVVQFVTDAVDGVLTASSVVELSRVRLLKDANSAFASWLTLFEWVEGRREAVTFLGDAGTAITTLSDHVPDGVAPANEREIPLSFSFYAYRLSQYITGVLFCVACVVCFYIVTSVARIEGMNMVTFNQVAGLVWIGRPLILLRSLTAICALSTSNLVMASRAGPVSRMVEVTAPWYKTFLSTAELNWLVFVLEDIMSIVTKQRAFTCTVQNRVLAIFLTSFLTQSTMLSWATSGTWSAIFPARHAVSVRRECTLSAVDLDVACTSGLLAYGVPSGFCGLIILASVCSVAAFGLKLVFLERATAPPTRKSAFLPAVATYSFNFSKWEVDDVVFIDKPSAILAGVLILESDHHFYVFDIKNWRCYAIDTTAARKSIEQDGSMQHLYHALPLTE